MSNGPEITPLASPPTSEPWVPLWPLSPSALGELAYAELASDVSITATAEASAQTILTAPALTLDGATPVMIEWFCAAAQLPAGAGPTLAVINLWDNTLDRGRINLVQSPVTAGSDLIQPLYGRRRLVPTVGSHTFTIRGWKGGSLNPTLLAASPRNAMFIRVSLAAPIMPHVAGAALPVSYGTSLPGGPLDGQEAILVDSVTAPTFQWRFRYNAGSSHADKWEFIGGAPRTATGSLQIPGAGAWTNIGAAAVTGPCAGIYRCEIWGRALNQTATPQEILFGNGSYTWSRATFVGGSSGSGYASFQAPFSAGAVLNAQGYVTGLPVMYENAEVQITPIRVS